ncbi:MAG: hypothetical protein RIS65_1365 [Pseudomonadota bacterium]|jgi:hypothetical protein
MAKMMSTSDDPNKVDASPTKSFFVDVITKDIQLDDAIQDLLDNCVDGAKRLRGINGNYAGLEVKLEINADRFSIVDNCGGIPLDVARNHAFKFGRPKGYKPTTGSVGLFGVGMKRALFKLGEQFTVKTVETQASYEISVDVEAWAQDDENWDFDLSNLVNADFPTEDTGTDIVVQPLERSVGETFGMDWFVRKVKNDIRIAQQHPMRLGLSIKVNGESIISSEWQLKEGEGIASSLLDYTDDIEGRELRTRIYAGIGESNRVNAGWYIFCNGRCILEADQTSITGWSQISESGLNIPGYHPQFARFRGYAFLDADDSTVLPWNTMKTGLDPETPAYRRLQSRLIGAARPIIDFLNGLDAEKDFEPDDRVLTKAVTQAASVPLAKISNPRTFIYAPPPKKGPALVRISYQKTKADAQALMEALDARSIKETGEKSFDFAANNLLDGE